MFSPKPQFANLNLEREFLRASNYKKSPDAAILDSHNDDQKVIWSWKIELVYKDWPLSRAHGHSLDRETILRFCSC